MQWDLWFWGGFYFILDSAEKRPPSQDKSRRRMPETLPHDFHMSVSSSPPCSCRGAEAQAARAGQGAKWRSSSPHGTLPAGWASPASQSIHPTNAHNVGRSSGPQVPEVRIQSLQDLSETSKLCKAAPRHLGPPLAGSLQSPRVKLFGFHQKRRSCFSISLSASDDRSLYFPWHFVMFG